jgi:hypothetical protein
MSSVTVASVTMTSAAGSTVTSYSPAYSLERATAPRRKGIFHRFLDRMIAARMAKAEELIRQHRHLLPRELEDQASWKVTERSESSLPFIR